MKNTELKKLRNKALYLAYKDGLEKGCFATMREAAKYVCKHPAPRFFIEAEKASVLVGKILSNVSLINLNTCSRRLVWQLYHNYQDYIAKHPGCKLSRERIMEILVDEPAPEFYLEPQRTRKILYTEFKKARMR